MANNIDRKAQSLKILQGLGIPTLDSLPPIADDSDVQLRAQDEVVERMIGAMIIAVYGETQDRALIENIIEQYQAQNGFTPAEQALLDHPNPSAQDFVNAGWRYEAVWVLFWSLGFVDEVGAHDQIADVPLLAKTFNELGREGLFAKAKMRSKSEILDYANFIYRLNWAAVDARVNGSEMPRGIDPSIAVERHHAANWLIRYMDQAWDEVSTDT